MTQPPPSWSDLEALDEVFMTAGEGDIESVTQLCQALAAADPPQIPLWPAPVRESWEAGVELVLESLDRANLRSEEIQLIRQLACAGFETPLFRDVLAAAARTRFSEYLDPRGLLAALRVQDGGVPTPAVARRWDVFAELEVGVCCFHPAHGVGAVAEVDTVGSDVHVAFERRQRLPLDIALSDLVVVRKGFLVDRLRRGDAKWAAASREEGFRRKLDESLLTAADKPRGLARKLLVPAVVSASEFAEFAGQSRPRHEREETPKGAPAGRKWDNARSIVELVDLLTKQTPTDAQGADTDNLRAILHAVAPRPEEALRFSEAVARLWRFAADAPWLTELLRETATDTACWQDQDLFIKLADKMPGKLVPLWNAATVAAQGVDYLTEVVMGLPLRLWTHAERVLKATDEGDELLMRKVLGRIRSADVSADAMLWLWKTKSPQRRALADPPLLFRTLAKHVRGSFLRARKEMRKLLMQDEEFQRMILHDGDPDAVKNLVRCIRHLPLLDSGEQQSLLVKIVRIYPEARPLVEERSREPERKPIGKVTSVRSFELRRRELEEIINVKIPANSRAIAHARSYGDLRENAEYKAAKEEQAYLGARRLELELGLHDIRATDFRDVTVGEEVVPGCSVSVTYEDGREEQFHVLGLWDSVPEQSMVSYDTPVGRALLGGRVGDEVELPKGEAVIAQVTGLSEELARWVRGRDE